MLNCAFLWGLKLYEANRMVSNIIEWFLRLGVWARVRCGGVIPRTIFNLLEWMGESYFLGESFLEPKSLLWIWLRAR